MIMSRPTKNYHMPNISRYMPIHRICVCLPYSISQPQGQLVKNIAYSFTDEYKNFGNGYINLSMQCGTLST